ncbi:MAG: 3-phosphoshikimate 1-carboxyvinyltransferase [Acidimicrobiia bacterium]
MFTVQPLGRPAVGIVRPPGSKSLTNRALVVAALARPGASRLHGALEAADTVAMRGALRAFGVLIDDNDEPWLVLGTGGDLSAPERVIDAGASGTTARFVTAVASLAKGVTTVDGTARMRSRPIGPLVDALLTLGVNAVAPSGFPPVWVEGPGLGGGRVTVDASVSSQFASALLMVAPLADDVVEITLGGPVVSRPYLDGTVEVMRAFGAEVTVSGDEFAVAPTGYHKAHFEIEADASAAVYPAVAAAITGGRVLIRGIPEHSRQADLAVLDVLGAMGCAVTRSGDAIEIVGPDGNLRAVAVDLSSAPDGAMAVAVAALFAEGTSRLDGLSTLRVKETDRLAALETEIRRIGGEIRIVGDALEVTGGLLTGAEIETYDDHRMAMSMSLVGLVVPGIAIRHPGVVSKTWPGFFDVLATL